MNKRPLLKATNIPKQPLGDIYLSSLTLHSGESIRLSGKNGAGKSSVLRALAGLYDDEKMQMHAEELLWISDQPLVVNGLSVQELLRYFACLYDWLGFDAGIVLPFDSDQAFASLSLGQKQRVNLTRLAYSKAHIWLLDEPERGLDDVGVAWLNEMIGVHTKRGGGVIYASHDTNLLCHRMIEV